LKKKLIDVAQEAPETVLMAEDEAGLYLQATMIAVWAPRGQTPVVYVHPGREKVNFYGTLNLCTGEEIVMRSTVMNAETTAQHLQQILDTAPDVPILLLWDRAPWHRGQPIRDVLEANPRLEVMCFPVATPDLNPQEHVWKATRRAASHNHLTPRLPELADQFEQHLTSNTFESSFLDRYGFNAICPMFK
jgi:transposase